MLPEAGRERDRCFKEERTGKKPLQPQGLSFSSLGDHWENTVLKGIATSLRCGACHILFPTLASIDRAHS